MELKKILITGSTDGIGLETTKKLKSLGHTVIVHGRNKKKLEDISEELNVETFKSDLSDFKETELFTNDVLSKHQSIDILINNAGVYKTSSPITETGLDVRFAVNTIAPYLITKKLLPILKNGRVINLSSAAQSSVNINALLGEIKLDDFEAYAQSKLAIAMWSRYLSYNLGDNRPIFISVNPGSLLGTKMVKEGFNTAGKDINIGVNILISLALDKEHDSHSGEYYDNDNQMYASLQADGLNYEKAKDVVQAIETALKSY